MWRNREVVRFLRWLRGHNAERALSGRVGFYGLDLYSLHRSIACVIGYLEKVDPQAAHVARQRYGSFDNFGDELRVFADDVRVFLENRGRNPRLNQAGVCQFVDGR